MSIPASNIVNVTPRVISAGGTDLEFAGLFITANSLCTFPGAMAFSSGDAVGEYFGEDSTEYKVAQKYFLGYDNSFRKPRHIYFTRDAVTAALAGELIGGPCASLEDLKKITEGAFSVTIDSTTADVSSLDLSAATSYSNAAELIQTAITGAGESGTTVTYSSVTKGFIVTSGTTGEESAVEFATGTDADALGLSQEAGAVQSAGSVQLTPAAQMKAITDQTQNWATFTTLEQPADDTVLGYCEWANGQNVDYLYVVWSDKTADKLNSNTNNLPNQILELAPEGVCMVWGGLDYAAFIMAIAGSIDWSRNNGLVTFKFKSQDGLTPSVTDAADADSLLAMKVNYYGRYATRADDFIMLAEGTMMGGNYGYIDAFLGMVWLKNNIQLSCMNGFANVGRVPYNEAGYTIIKAWCGDTIERAKTNGVIQAGVSLSQSQKAQLFNEIGADVANQIYTDGYYLMVEDPGADARVDRDSPTIGLWFTYGGAVHRLEIPVTQVQ